MICAVAYAIDPTAAAYADQITRAVATISEATGMTFTLTRGDADITYRIVPRKAVPDGRTPIGMWNSRTRTVTLTRVRPRLRYPLVLHETMHAIGVGHTRPGNVSAELLTSRSTLGPDDLAALTAVGCKP